MRFQSRHKIIIVGMIALALGGCSDGREARTLIGLSFGDSAFNMSPDGCQLSALYDDFRVPFQRRGGRVNHMERRIELAGHPAGTLAIDLRGALIGEDAGTVGIKVGDNVQVKPLTGGGDPAVSAHFEFPLAGAAGRLPVTITATLESNRENVALEVDSVDMSLTGTSACR